jgi:ABC-type transport system involved in multi-copper enzyme maturation permease subunit
MVASFTVELEKLRRRPASWVLAGILVVFIVLVGYALNYAVLSATGGGAQSPFARIVMPEGMPSNVLTAIPSIGATLSVVLGAMFMGSEYRWDTIKANVVRRPGRIGLLGGKLIALLSAAAALALVALLTGLVCSLAISLLQGAGLASPPLLDTVAALGAGWLVLSVYAVLGLFLAVLVRGSGAAVAFGLVYVLVLESIISSSAGQIPGGQIVSNALPGGAAQALTGAIGQQGGPTGSGALSSPFAALAILGSWLILLTGASILLFSRRDAP